MATLLAESNVFRVGPAYALAFRPAPVALTGEPFTLQVDVLEGGAPTDAEIEIMVSFEGPGDVAGALIAQSVDGVATFHLTADAVGVYDFHASAEEAEMAVPESVNVGPGMVPIVAAVRGEDRVRLFFSLPVDGEFTPTFDPASYAIDGPLGTIVVTSIEVAGLRSVDLFIADRPEVGDGTLSIVAGAALSTTGAPSIAESLLFSFAEGGGELEPPEVSNVTPPAGAALGRNGAVGFDVTDNVALARVTVAATLNGRREVVHDALGFAPQYNGSTKATIAGGLRFEVRRVGGWPVGSMPTITVEAIDVAGNIL